VRGTESTPTCLEPDSSCSISSGGELNLCFPVCDPLAQDCGDGEACYPVDFGFVCAPVALQQEGDGGLAGACEFINGCLAGLYCGQGADFCEEGAYACCLPFCDLTEPDCPAPLDCSPVFESGEGPPGFGHVGICSDGLGGPDSPSPSHLTRFGAPVRGVSRGLMSDSPDVDPVRRPQLQATLCAASLWSVAALLGCSDFVQADGGNSSGGATASATENSSTQGVAPTSTSSDASSPETSGGSNPTTDPSDGESSDSSGGTASGVCGDGVLGEGEACDDGNTDDDDGCTADCELSSCRDGRQNGMETAVDCGGACLAQCQPGEGCQSGPDCAQGVCNDSDVCARPSCDDGVHNGAEATADCGPVCGTQPSNVILNGGFESEIDDWVVENPEVNPQDAYFDDGESNPVAEVDRSGNNTSRWEQGFQVPEYQVGVTLELRVRVADRLGQGGDVGGLLIGIAGPDGISLVLTGVAGADFYDNNSTQLSVDATSVASFRTVVVEFEPTAAGGHILELLEQTSGGNGLNDGGGIVMDDVEVLLVDCEG